MLTIGSQDDLKALSRAVPLKVRMRLVQRGGSVDIRSETSKTYKLGAEGTHFDADHSGLPVGRGDRRSSASGTDDKLIFLVNGTDSIVFRLQRVERDRKEASPLGHGGRGNAYRGVRSGKMKAAVKNECGFWLQRPVILYDTERWMRCSTGGTFPRRSSGVRLSVFGTEQPFIQRLTRRKWRRVTSVTSRC